MSWDSYVEHLMVDLPHGGKLTSAAIVGTDGGVWAQSPNFPAVTPEQVRIGGTVTAVGSIARLTMS